MNIPTNSQAIKHLRAEVGAGPISTAFIPKTAAPLRAEFRIINRAGGTNTFRFIDAQTL